MTEKLANISRKEEIEKRIPITIKNHRILVNIKTVRIKKENKKLNSSLLDFTNSSILVSKWN